MTLWAEINSQADVLAAAHERLRNEVGSLGQWIRDSGASHLVLAARGSSDNAGRYASDSPGAIHVRLAERDDQTALLAVASDGAAIAADVERHLFEPFFSTRSRGTGLGLYICRELCVRHGGNIEFRPLAGNERHRNEFRVTMQRAALTPESTTLA